MHFVFRNVQVGYKLSEQDNELFIEHLEGLLEEDMNLDYELINVAYASRFELDPRIPSFPVRITVWGPNHHSDNDAFDYVIEKVKDRKTSLENFLKGLDPNAFGSLRLEIESRHLPDIEVPTFVRLFIIRVCLRTEYAIIY